MLFRIISSVLLNHGMTLERDQLNIVVVSVVYYTDNFHNRSFDIFSYLILLFHQIGKLLNYLYPAFLVHYHF